MRGRLIAALLLLMLGSVVASAQDTLKWKRDTIYAGPGGGAIATVTPAPSDTTAPGAPSGLGTTSTTATSVALSWTGSSDSGGSGLAGYKIYRAKGSGASLPVGTVDSSTTAFTDQPLEPSTSYTYTIVAFDNAQNHSSASSSVNPTTSSSSGDSTSPSAPANLRGIPTTRQSTYKVRLDWDAATDVGGSGVNGYKVYRNDTLISGSNPITARYYEDSTNTANTAFTYKVKAVDGASNLSGYSNAETVTTLRELVLSENFNHADGSYDADWANLNNTLEQIPRVDPLHYVDWVVPDLDAQTSFVASVKFLGRHIPYQGYLSSGFTFWATLGSGDPVEEEENYCHDYYGAWTPWAANTGFYRVYEDSGYLRLDFYPTCDAVVGLASSATALPAGAGTLKLETNSSTRRIKAYWNGTLVIDYTETNTSRPNSGSLALGGLDFNSVSATIFDDLLVEK